MSLQMHFSPSGSSGSQRGFTERTLVVWFCVAVGLVVVFAGLVLLNREVWSRRAEAKIAELAAEGYPVTVEDLERRHREATPEENAADIYREAFSVQVKADYADERLPVFGAGELPEPGEPFPDGMAERTRQFLEENAEAMDLFLSATRVSDCTFPVEVGVDGMPELSYIGPMRDGARLLSLKVILDAEEGRASEAAEAAAAIVRMNDHLREEPFLIVALTRLAILGIGTSRLSPVLNGEDLPEGVLARLQRDLAAAEDELFWTSALEGEIVFGIHSFQNMSAHIHEYFGSPAGPVEYFESGLWKFQVYHAVGQMDRDLCRYIERMREMLEKARGPLEERVADDPATNASWEIDDPSWGEFIKGRWMSEQLSLSIDRLFEAEGGRSQSCGRDWWRSPRVVTVCNMVIFPWNLRSWSAIFWRARKSSIPIRALRWNTRQARTGLRLRWRARLFWQSNGPGKKRESIADENPL